MRFRNRYILLLTLPLALLLNGCGGDEGALRYTFEFGEPFPQSGSLTTTGAVVNASYSVSTDADPTFEAGVMIKIDGGSDPERPVKPATYIRGTRRFTVTLSGLEPSTTYSVRIYAKSGNDIFYSATRTFTTLDRGVEPVIPSQPGWGELPGKIEREGVSYVTHYVTSDGNSMADDPNISGRVRSYTVAYDTKGLRTLWVAAPMHKWYLGNTKRTDEWDWDPSFPHSVQPDLSSSYSGNDLDRGHLLASGDRTRSKLMNYQTFYFTNMAPQRGEKFNQAIWAKLENKIRDPYITSDTLFMVTGLIYEGNKTTTDRTGRTFQVPSHFYKVLLTSKSGNTGKWVGELSASQLKCAAFLFENVPHSDTTPSSKYMTSVAAIEKRVGYTFFPTLSAEAASVKENYNPKEWDM